MKKIVYIDMDNTVVDFVSGINKLSEKERDEYKGEEDNHPQIFSMMEPMPGAIDAINKLSDKYDFLIVGGGLIGALTALSLYKKNFKVLVIDKKNNALQDKRTLAVNANSREFLEQLGVWKNISSKPQIINKIFKS